jgi:glyoxylase-like metal-dependent hydrolase (beta-lactamase superfamily II)/rhodanese-related sulfurtransferase
MVVVLETETVEIERIRGAEGCVGYLVVDAATREALAIDPCLDQVARFQELAAARGARLVFALDTHTHADHLSGVRRLAAATGASVLAHAASKLRAKARRLEGGATFELGHSVVRVIHAPGHTPDSLALLVAGHLFTGDALFVGGAGRTDFMGGSPADLFDTFRRFEALPEGTVVHPGHDYVGRATTTIGEERRTNPLFAERDRGALTAKLSRSLPPPANMAQILGHNLADADSAAATATEVASLRSSPGACVLVDVRSALEFESEHVEGAINIPLAELEARTGEVPEGGELVVVCRTGIKALGAAETLGRHGRTARVLEGGVVGWRKAGLPLREGRKRLPVDRQVQLIAGTAVVSGTALGAFVSPWFLGIVAFFGAGLMCAGLTGTCGLALVLEKLPWNRRTSSPGAGSTCSAPTCSA